VGYGLRAEGEWLSAEYSQDAGPNSTRAMATLMLEGGADIRYIQQMLGHEDLQSTEIYTHVAICVLQQIHAATHPGALIESKNADATSHDSHDEQRKAALLAALDAEGEEDE